MNSLTHSSNLTEAVARATHILTQVARCCSESAMDIVLGYKLTNQGSNPNITSSVCGMLAN